jgi:flagellar hook-basal body complex protein FliE
MDINEIARAAGIDLGNQVTSSGVNTSNSTAFDKFLESAMNMISETDSLQKDAEQAELNYELGYSDNTHDLAVAQNKANVSLQYTVAVRDRLVQAYKELMQMQI